MSLRLLPMLVVVLAACAPPDVNREAARLVEDPDRGVLTLSALRGPPALPPGVADFEVPQTIDVWRKSIDGASYSCDGIIETVEFEDYVRGVLPQEWIRSWEDESLRAGAVAIRTYAAWWVNAGGKYDCADIDDTTSSQVYDDDRYEETDDAVAYTTGIYIVEEGSLVFAEYSAENGDPTEYGVSEPHCTGEAVFGHGRGTCQWGTQRWADIDGMTFDWMAGHYYPGSTLVWAWDAEASSEDLPLELPEGDTVELTFEFLNLGTSVWEPSAVLLATEDGADFYVEGDWVSTTEVATVDGDTAMGAYGAFTFPVQAPEVDEDTVYEVLFTLQSVEGSFGPSVTWTVLVTDSELDEPGDTGSDPGPPGGGGGGDGGEQPGGPEHVDTYGPGQRVLPGGCSHGAPMGSFLGLAAVGALLRRQYRR